MANLTGVSPGQPISLKKELLEIAEVVRVELWIWRKMGKISWTAKVSNSEVLNRVKENRCIISMINQRKRRWLGHVLRHDVLLRDVLEGRMDNWETYEREKETTADEQHMRGIRNSKETS